MDTSAYLTADEAAELLNTTPMRVLMLLKHKALTGEFSDGEWLVTKDSVLAWQAAPLDKKQVKTCASACSGCSCS